jgi:hypothetical protein
MRKILRFIVSPILTVAVIGLVVFFGGRFIPGFPTFSITSKTTDSQVITAIKRTEQVSLLQLGIQGITSKTESSKMLGMDVPGSQRAKYIQYNFDAKLGIEGKDVVIQSTQTHHFTVSIPKFIFIGYNNTKYQVVAENNGALSWTTPGIDSTELINKLLNDKVKEQYLKSNDAALRDQTKVFYSSIITGVDPDAKISFQFA